MRVPGGLYLILPPENSPFFKLGHRLVTERFLMSKSILEKIFVIEVFIFGFGVKLTHPLHWKEIHT